MHHDKPALAAQRVSARRRAWLREEVSAHVALINVTQGAHKSVSVSLRRGRWVIIIVRCFFITCLLRHNNRRPTRIPPSVIFAMRAAASPSMATPRARRVAARCAASDVRDACAAEAPAAAQAHAM